METASAVLTVGKERWRVTAVRVRGKAGEVPTRGAEMECRIQADSEGEVEPRCEAGPRLLEVGQEVSILRPHGAPWQNSVFFKTESVLVP